VLSIAILKSDCRDFSIRFRILNALGSYYCPPLRIEDVYLLDAVVKETLLRRYLGTRKGRQVWL
jgi:hypothetical protein